LIFIPGLLLAQEEFSMDYKILYEAEYSMDSTNLDNKNTEPLYLYSSSTHGVLMNYYEAHKEEIMADLQRQLKTSGQINIQKPISTNFSKVFYKDLASGKVQTLGKIDRKNYLYQEDQTPLKWNIEEGTKEIAGYAAQKATTHFSGRDYEAWFTMEIPIPDGPYVFAGLPGLIIELYDTEDHYHFTMTSIEKLKEPKSIELPKVIEIAKEKFEEVSAEVEKNKLHNMLEMGNVQIIRSGSGEKMDRQTFKRQIQEKNARKNNPIER